MSSRFLINGFLAALLTMTTLVACQQKKVSTEEISFQGNKVVYQDKPFTGEVWTQDGKFGCFHVEDGDLRSCTFHHDNGQTAIIMELPKDGSHTPVTQLFDEEGNTLDMMGFQRRYLALWIKIAMVQGELINK